MSNLQFDNRQSSTSVVHVAVTEVERHLSAFAALVVQAVQVIARQLLECAGTCAVKDGHFPCSNHERIVHVRNQFLQRFIGTIAAQIERALERDGAAVHEIGIRPSSIRRRQEARWSAYSRNRIIFGAPG